MFEKFKFSSQQITKYYQSAIRDLRISSSSKVTEVSFRFCYDALLKLAIAVCASEGLRVKARQGHYIELISKLAFFLKDKEIEILANEMRSKRNWDLYGGGVVISQKEAEEYKRWTKNIFQKAEKIFKEKEKQQNLKLKTR
jgi:hypothetical protein